MDQTMMIGIVLFVFIMVCILFEAIIITLFKINRFSKSVMHSGVINIISLLVIYFIWPLLSDININESKLFPLLPLLWFVTVVVEGLLLLFLNQQINWKKIFAAAAVMNFVSFLIIYLLLYLFLNF